MKKLLGLILICGAVLAGCGNQEAVNPVQDANEETELTEVNDSIDTSGEEALIEASVALYVSILEDSMDNLSSEVDFEANTVSFIWLADSSGMNRAGQIVELFQDFIVSAHESFQLENLQIQNTEMVIRNGETGEDVVIFNQTGITYGEVGDLVQFIELGDTFEIDGFEITLIGKEIVDWVERDSNTSLSWGWEPDAGSMFVLFELSARNNNTEIAELFNPSSRRGEMGARIMYRDSFEFLRTDFLGWEYRLERESVNPLSTITGKVPFMVPSEALDSDDNLVLELFIGNEIFRYNMR